jgi:hypothetical protein
MWHGTNGTHVMDGQPTILLGIYLCSFLAGVLLPALPGTLRFELLVLSCLPTGLFGLYYLHLVDDLPLYYNFRSIPYIELSSGLLGLGIGIVVREMHARNMRLLVAVLVPSMAVVSMLPYVKHVFSPLDTAPLQERWDGPYCLQSTGHTCGPASLATFLSLAGKKESERDVARASLTTASGTEVWYLARHAREKGLEAHFEHGRLEELKGKRGIIGVKLGGGAAGHLLALLGCDGETVDCVDPMSGHKRLRLDEFRHAYEYTGFLMTLK